MPNFLSNKFTNLLSKFTHSSTEPTSIQAESFSSFGEYPEISLDRIVSRYLTNSKFDYVLQLYAAYSVGRGYINTVNTETPRAKACLEMINEFTTKYNLQELNFTAMYEAWASGNTFFDIPGDGNHIDALYNIPLSSIISINRESNGTVIDYQQQLGGQYRTLLVENVAHLKINPKNGSAFGEMLGQPMERKGQGYKAPNGTTNLVKASLFDIDEMTDDVSSKMYFAGQPNYVVTPKDKDAIVTPKDIKSLLAIFKKRVPLQHILTNKRIDVQTTELSTQSKHGDYIQRARENFIIATKSAVIPLIATMDFSYASSQTALETAIPLIIIMQSQYSNLINQQIYRPLTIQEGKDPNKIQVQITWKTIDRLSIELLTQSYNILKDPKFDGLWNPEDIVQGMRDLGVPLQLPSITEQKMIKQKATENRIIAAIQEVIDNPRKAKEIADATLQ